MIKKVFKIRDMHCPTCVMRVEGIEDDLPGIKQVSASYQKGQMVVEFDETKVGELEIINAVKKKGYTAQVI